MSADRFVVLGLAQARTSWFRELARWSTTAMVPVEFLKAISVEEVQARLRAGRSYSALIVDGSVHGVDRDLLDLARSAGCAVLVVGGTRPAEEWRSLGASALLPDGFDRSTLLQVLGQVSQPVPRHEASIGVEAAGPTRQGFRGALVAVTGAGGTGASTTAIAIAQHLAADPRYAGQVCLADLALHADQAMLHGSADVVPGVAELVEAHRAGRPSIDDVRALTWHVPARGYHLLLGLRRHRDWTAIRPRAFDAALEGLRRSFRLVVADVTGDVEGEEDTGSLDVADRNTMARAAVAQAEVVAVVGQGGMKGLHSLVRTVQALERAGVRPEAVLPVLNRTVRRARGRAEMDEAYEELAARASPASRPVHLPDKRAVEHALRDGTALPDAISRPVGSAVLDRLEQAPAAASAPAAPDDGPVRVQPGTLGAWAAADVRAGEVG